MSVIVLPFFSVNKEVSLCVFYAVEDILFTRRTHRNAFDMAWLSPDLPEKLRNNSTTVRVAKPQQSII